MSDMTHKITVAILLVWISQGAYAEIPPLTGSADAPAAAPDSTTPARAAGDDQSRRCYRDFHPRT